MILNVLQLLYLLEIFIAPLSNLRSTHKHNIMIDKIIRIKLILVKDSELHVFTIILS